MRLLLLCLVILCFWLIQPLSGSPLPETPAASFDQSVLPLGIMISEYDRDLNPEPLAKTAFDGKPSACLAKLTPAERANAMIFVEVPENSSASAKNMATQVSELWDKGQYEEAMAVFDQIPDKINQKGLAVACNWRTPVPTPSAPNNAKGFVSDIPIGSQTKVLNIALDIHRSSNTLYAMTRTTEEDMASLFSIYLSHDTGSSWETAGWLGLIYDEARRTTAAILGDKFLISYACDKELRLSRCGLDGYFEDVGSGGLSRIVYTLADSVEGGFVDVCLSANEDYAAAHSSEHMLDIFAISGTHRLYSFWSANYGGTISWDILRYDADRGLNACYNDIYIIGGISQFISYIDTADYLKIYSPDAGHLFGKNLNSASPDRTAIAAYHDTITCAYEYHYSTRLGCQYVASYDGGDTWLYGWPDDTSTTTEAPSIAALGGGGVGMIYRYYTSRRDGRFTWRPYKGTWTDPVRYTDNGVYYYEHAIQYLGNDLFGIAYMTTSSPSVRGPYFARGRTSSCCHGLRGNIDNSPDELVSLGDLTAMIDHLFISLEPPICWEEANLDASQPEGEGSVSLGDLTALIDVLFISLIDPPPCP